MGGGEEPDHIKRKRKITDPETFYGDAFPYTYIPEKRKKTND